MNLYVSFDGDHIGRMVGRMSLADDVEGIRRVGQAIDTGNEVWRSWCLTALGEVIEIGGDEGRIMVPADQIGDLERIRHLYASSVGSTVSVGVGTRMSEADRALMAAKLRGGDQILLYTPECEETIRNAKSKTEAEKQNEAYLGKADGPSGPPPGSDSEATPTNKPNAGGGFTTGEAPGQGDMTGGAPTGPMAEGSEHSEGEQMVDMADNASSPEGTHAAEDFEDEMHSHAQEQSGKDEASEKAADQKEDARTKIVEILTQVKQMAPQLEQLRDQAPDLYQAQMAMVQALMLSAQALLGNEEPDGDEGSEQSGSAPEESSSAPVSKAEMPGVPPAPMPMHNTVEGFMAGLKQHPAGSPARGKFITAHMNHGPFLSALQAHPQGPKIHATLTSFMNSRGNAGFKPGAAVAVAKDELEQAEKRRYKLEGDALIEVDADGHSLGKGPVNSDALEKVSMTTGRTHLNLPVGAQNNGKIKVEHEGGKQGWVSARAGQVLSNDGHPISSRNPGGR